MKKIIYLSLFCIALFSCKQNTSQKTTESPRQEGVIYCMPRTTDKEWYTSGKKAPKFKGLAGIDFRISTKNEEAQAYFNQGMMLSYGFNHAEAARSFYEAIRIDSSCAMCYWGYSYVLGPNYNAGMEEDNFQRAYDAAQTALSLIKNCTQKEADLIRALSVRYAKTPPVDRKPLDIAYSEKMKKVYGSYQSDPDVSALYAESLMDLHPWDLYDKQTKAHKPWTPELIATLEHLMKINPRHPGAHHFYIHAVEASATPERGLASARLFETLVPGSGHLVHMSSHIYINTGDYHLGSLSNLKAVEVDSNYITSCHAQGAYPLAYYPHNYHFLAATATLEGNSKLAWEAAKKVQQNTAEDIMRQPGWGTLQHYYTIPYYLAVKFEMWDTIFAIPKPDSGLIYPSGVWHYVRGMAYLGKNNLKEAENELGKLQVIAKDTSLQSLTIWGINTTADLMQIAVKVLSAEIAAKKKQYDESIRLFYEAIALEDKLNYDEPPDWFFSVRHLLGEVLIKTGKYSEAEKVYRRDLVTWRRNGWALFGLYTALNQQGKNEEAKKTKEEFDIAWKYSDFDLRFD